jgi:hypothetical protein
MIYLSSGGLKKVLMDANNTTPVGQFFKKGYKVATLDGCGEMKFGPLTSDQYDLWDSLVAEATASYRGGHTTAHSFQMRSECCDCNEYEIVEKSPSFKSEGL